MQAESILQQQICDYLRLSYPRVIFRSDFASGLKLNAGQAVRHRRLQSGRAFPDLFIYEPRQGKHGLAIELKKDGTRIWKKDGELVADQHIQEQAAILEKLSSLGYAAEFGVGFSLTKHIIDDYLRE